MSAAKDGMRQDVTGQGVSATRITATARQFFVVGEKSCKVWKWVFPGPEKINQKLHKAFFEGTQASLSQAVSMAPKKIFVFHVKNKGTRRISYGQVMTGQLAGLAGGGVSTAEFLTGGDKKKSWLGGGHVLPITVRNLAGWYKLSEKKESIAVKSLLLKPKDRVTRGRSFAPVGMAAPLRANILASRIGASVDRENIHPQRPWQADADSHGLAPAGGRLQPNKREYEYGFENAPGFAGRDPRAEGRDMSRAIDDYFARQARLPPSGAMAFDPRLTPTWAGLKLPV